MKLENNIFTWCDEEGCSVKVVECKQEYIINGKSPDVQIHQYILIPSYKVDCDEMDEGTKADVNAMLHDYCEKLFLEGECP